MMNNHTNTNDTMDSKDGINTAPKDLNKHLKKGTGSVKECYEKYYITMDSNELLTGVNDLRGGGGSVIKVESIETSAEYKNYKKEECAIENVKETDGFMDLKTEPVIKKEQRISCSNLDSHLTNPIADVGNLRDICSSDKGGEHVRLERQAYEFIGIKVEDESEIKTSSVNNLWHKANLKCTCESMESSSVYNYPTNVKQMVTTDGFMDLKTEPVIKKEQRISCSNLDSHLTNPIADVGKLRDMFSADKGGEHVRLERQAAEFIGIKVEDEGEIKDSGVNNLHKANLKCTCRSMESKYTTNVKQMVTTSSILNQTLKQDLVVQTHFTTTEKDLHIHSPEPQIKREAIESQLDLDKPVLDIQHLTYQSGNNSNIFTSGSENIQLMIDHIHPSSPVCLNSPQSNVTTLTERRKSNDSEELSIEIELVESQIAPLKAEPGSLRNSESITNSLQSNANMLKERHNPNDIEKLSIERELVESQMSPHRSEPGSSPNSESATGGGEITFVDKLSCDIYDNLPVSGSGNVVCTIKESNTLNNTNDAVDLQRTIVDSSYVDAMKSTGRTTRQKPAICLITRKKRKTKLPTVQKKNDTLSISRKSSLVVDKDKGKVVDEALLKGGAQPVVVLTRLKWGGDLDKTWDIADLRKPTSAVDKKCLITKTKSLNTKKHFKSFPEKKCAQANQKIIIRNQKKRFLRKGRPSIVDRNVNVQTENRNSVSPIISKKAQLKTKKEETVSHVDGKAAAEEYFDSDSEDVHFQTDDDSSDEWRPDDQKPQRIFRNKIWGKKKSIISQGEIIEDRSRGIATKTECKKRSGFMLSISDRLVRCKVCQNEFDNTDGLLNHLQKYLEVIHENVACEYTGNVSHLGTIPTVTIQYKCKLCDNQIFDLYDEWKEHMLVHIECIKHECKVCHIHFKSKSKYQRHRRKHIGYESNYKCGLCDCNFPTLTSLLSHKFSHEKSRNYKCKFCGHIFSNSRKMHQHMLLHSQNNPYQCKVCKKSYTSLRPLQNHTKLHDIGWPYKCAVCEKIFKFRSILKSHMVTHTKEKAYQCHLCSKRFVNIFTLRLHILIHTGKMPFKCRHCGKPFQYIKRLQRHEFLHSGLKPYKCSICSKGFNNTGNVKIHMVTHTGIRSHECQVCHKTYTTKGVLTKHMRIHTGEKPYTCEICGQSFPLSSSLHSHKLYHQEDKPWKCSVCSRAFKIERYLKTHMVVHTGVGALQCNICGILLSSRHALTSHLKIHNGIKPYKCKQCDKCYSDAYNLLSHVRNKHTFEKPFACNQCGRKFAIKKALTAHLSTHLKKRPKFPCKECSVVYSKKGNLTYHVKHKHS